MYYQPLASRHHEDLSGQVRVECLGAVVGVEERFALGHQVPITRGEGIPGVLSSVSFYPFINQKEKRVGDGLVIEAVVAVPVSKAFDPLDDPGQRRRNGIQVQVEPGQPEMIAVAKTPCGQRAPLKSFDKSLLFFG